MAAVASVQQSMVESIADKLFKALSHAKDENKAALIVKKEQYSYKELKHRSFSFASFLLQHQVKRVSLCTGRTVDMYSTIAGSIVSGVTYVPLNMLFPAKKSAFICEHSESSHIFIAPECIQYASQMLTYCSEEFLRATKLIMTKDVQSALLDVLSTLKDKSSDVSEQKLAAASLAVEQTLIYEADDAAMERAAQSFDFTLARAHMSDDDIMHILYTSGTTGSPKGVMVTRANWSQYFKTISDIYQYQETDIFSNFSEITFDISLQDPICAWVVGGTVVCATKRDLMNAVRFIDKHQITVVHSTPALVSYLKKSGFFKENALPSVRISIFIGEALWYKQAADFALLCPNTVIYNTYGPTEATVAVSIYKVPADVLKRFQGESNTEATNGALESSSSPITAQSVESEALQSIVPLGSPFNEVEFSICDEQGNEKSEGEVGELLIGGSQVTPGYLKMPEKNAATFVEHKGSRFYRTGDLVSYTHDTLGLRIYHYIGRDGDMLKLHGHRVSLYEVDEQFGSITEHVVRAIAYEIPEAGGRSNQLVLAVEGATPEECERILSEGKSLLAVYMHPSMVLSLKEFPLNVNGKVDRKAIKQQLMPKFIELTGHTDVR